MRFVSCFFLSLSFSSRVLAAVDGADPFQLFLLLLLPLGQVEEPAAAEAAGDQSDRLQRGL